MGGRGEEIEGIRGCCFRCDVSRFLVLVDMHGFYLAILDRRKLHKHVENE